MREKKMLALVDAVIAVLLFFFGSYAGRQHLADLNHGRSPVTSIEMLYGPAVMLACGRGFYQPDLAFSPPLGEFLRNERETLSPDVLPKHLPEAENSVSSYHRYLLYTVAFFWRIYGISWAGLEPLCALLLGICAFAVYGIMRLGMGRLLSAGLAVFFTLSPQMLTMMNSLRDFSKAPFILLLIFILGAMIKYRFRFGTLAALSIVLGLLNGIAMGFRQDALVFVAPALVIVPIAAFRARHSLRWSCLLPPLLFLAAFLATAHPMLGRMEGGAQPYHPMVQGFSMKRAASLGMEPGAYEPLASGSDNYTFAMLQDYYRRVNKEPDAIFGFNSPGAEKAGRQFLADMAFHFPADLLARGYAALLRTLRYTDGIPIWSMAGSFWKDLFETSHFTLKNHLHYFGIIYAGIAILLISGHSLSLAFGLLFFVLFICGYVSLQCEFRHAFHLSFVPLWILGFLFQRLMAAPLLLRKKPLENRGLGRNNLKRMAAFALGATIVVLAPLYLLRAFQYYQVKPLLAAIASSERIPVPVEKHSELQWTRFTLRESESPIREETSPQAQTDLEALYVILARIVQSVYSGDGQQAWQTKARYFALELSSGTPLEWIVLLYDSPAPWNNFSQIIRVRLPKSEESSILYLFPAYELTMPSPIGVVRNHFKGFALPENLAGAFMNLYEVTDVSCLRFLMHAVLPPDAETPVRTYQRIQFTPDPSDAFRVDDEPVSTIGMAEAAARFGETEQAELLFDAALLVNQDPVQRLYIAKSLIAIGKYDAATHVVLNEIHLSGTETSFAQELLVQIIQRHIRQNETEKAEALLHTLHNLWAKDSPDLLLQALEIVSLTAPPELIEESCARLLLAHPEHQSTADYWEQWTHEHGLEERLALFWQRICSERPDSVLPFLRLGLVQEQDGAKAAAEAAYAAARTNNPSHPEAAIRHAVFKLESADPGEALEEIARALKEAPELKNLVARLLESVGDRLAARGAPNAAEPVYALAFACEPQKGLLGIKQANALLETRRFDEALSVIEKIMHTDRREEALGQLARVWEAQKSENERVASWRDMAGRHPEDDAVRRLYAEALFFSGRYTEAVELIQNADTPWRSKPEQEALLAIVRYAAGEETPKSLAGNALWKERTELKAEVVGLLNQAAQRMESESRFENALRLTNAAALLSPESETALLDLGRVHEANGRDEDAMRLYWQGFSSVNDVNQTIIAERIDALYERLGNNEERLKQWEIIHRQDSGNPVAAFHFGLACEANRQWREAADVYGGITSPEMLKHKANLRRGAALLRLGSIEEGAGLIRSAVSADPQAHALGAMLSLQAGNDFLLAGQVDEAEVISLLAVELVPEDAFIQLFRGDVLKAQERNAGAVQAWQNALHSGWNTMAGAEAGRRIDNLLTVEERLQFWEELAAAHPESPYPNARRALALLPAGRAAEALAFCRSVANETSTDMEARYACALTECATGDTEQGMAALDAILGQAPYLKNDALPALADFGLKQLETGNAEVAERLLRKVVELGPGNLLYYIHLGSALLAQKKYEEAAAQFRKVLLEVPESPNAAKLFDEALAGLNNDETRLREWQTVVNTHPAAAIPRNYLEALK